jgi:hypothetical protein
MIISLFSNFLVTLLVIGFATCIGLGILVLLGQRQFQYRLLVASPIALASSAAFLSIIVLAGIPIEKISTVIWIIWIALAIVGALHLRISLADLHNPMCLWSVLIGTAMVTNGYIIYGVFDYLGSPSLDGWSYVSFGEYLRLYPKGTEGDLAPIYQYAAHLSNTRFAASTMLAAMIPPWITTFNTQMTAGPLLILSVSNFAVSLGYVATSLNYRNSNVSVPLTVLIGTLGGWVGYSLHVNNYDNLLALSLSPLLFAIASEPNLNTTGRIALPAILISASIYIYPELSPLLIALYGLIIISQLLETKNTAKFYRSSLDFIIVAVIVLILITPYFRQVIDFFLQQLASSNSSAGRPGEGIMPSLLDITQIHKTLWAFGNHFKYEAILGLLLSATAAIGIKTLIAKKHWALIIYTLVIGCLYILMAAFKKYDYGVYKILLIGWWVISIFLAAGIKTIQSWIMQISSDLVQHALTIGLASNILIMLSAWVYQQYQWMDNYKQKTAMEFREAQNAVANIKGATQVMSNDTFLNSWLVYTLREENVAFNHYLGYMAQKHLLPYMHRAKTATKKEIEYILTDIDTQTIGMPVWEGHSLKLIKGTPLEQPPQLSIDAPNGVEKLGGKPFFWIDENPVSLSISTRKNTSIILKFETIIGPSLIAAPSNSLTLTLQPFGAEPVMFYPLATESHSVILSLTEGTRTLTFSVKYSGDTRKNDNGDPRLLLVGIRLIGTDFVKNE